MEMILQNCLGIFILSTFVMLIGQPISYLLPHQAKKPYSFFLSPVLGLAIIMLCSMAYGWLFAFTFQYSILVALILILISLWFIKYRLNAIKNSLIFGIFAVIASVPFLIPFLKYGGYNPGTDIYTYISQAQWMQLHPFKETISPTGYFPYLTQISLYQQTGSRMGASFILAYWQSLLHLSWAYEAFVPAVSVAFASGCLALIAGVKQFVNISFSRSIGLAFWTAFSLNGFQFGAAWGFYPQTYGLAFVAGAIALLPLIFNHFINHPISPWKEKIIMILPLGLLMGSFLQAYNEPFLIFGFGFGLFMVSTFFTLPQYRKICTQFFIVLLVEIALFTNYEMIRIFHNLFQTLDIANAVGSIGWVVPWTVWKFLTYSFGLQFTLGMKFQNNILAYGVFPCIFVLIIWTFIKLWQEKNLQKQTHILWLISIFFACAIAFIKFRFFSYSNISYEHGFTFLQFKIAKYLTPVSQIILLTSFAYVWKNLANYRNFFNILYTLALIILLNYQCSEIPSILHGNYFMLLHNEKYSMEQWKNLRHKLSFIPKNQPLYLNFKPDEFKIKQMMTYILYDRMITADFTDDGYIHNNLPLEERVKTRKNIHYQISIRKLKEEKSLIDDPVFILKHYEDNNI